MTPFIFSANTASSQYEDIWDYRFFIQCRIAAPYPHCLCWYFPCDSGWDYGYVEGWVWPDVSVEKRWKKYCGI